MSEHPLTILESRPKVLMLNTIIPNWRGTRVMRVIVLNWRTREKDVADAIESVRQVLEELDG